MPISQLAHERKHMQQKKRARKMTAQDHNQNSRALSKVSPKNNNPQIKFAG